MPSHVDIDLVVFDILGTLVNEPGGLHNSIRELAPTGSSIPGPTPSNPSNDSRNISLS
ncbi:hypothetical protein [Actinoallomurus purpureus]|uniref:hypothetical protein n=1 Tax=Actinoallomurus purpureus TaxID=478114 RepID=UPI003557074E